MFATNILGRSAHSGLDGFAGRIHEQLGEPLKHFLDLLNIGFLEVGLVERDANIGDATDNLVVGLLGKSLDTLCTLINVQGWLTRRMNASVSFCCCLPRPPLLPVACDRS